MERKMIFRVTDLKLVSRPEKDWEFQEGDVCVLNSGGPVMVVEGIKADGNRICKWWDTEERKQVESVFPSACLRPPFEMRVLMGGP